jgi:hypothetical protein
VQPEVDVVTFATGSGLERHMMCRASSVLHRSLDLEGSDASERGTQSHAFLQRISEGMTREESLDLVDERYRERCAGIDVDDLRDVIGLAPEISFAYNPLTDTARVLGRGINREYDAAGVERHEVPMTLDLVGVDNPDAPRVGIVIDYKDTWAKLTPAERNWQLRGGALALARAFDLDEVRAQLIYLRDGKQARRDRATYTAADLAVFAAEARVRAEQALRDRELYEETGREPDSARGSWCRFCPSYHACGAQISLVRAAVSRDEFDDVARVTPIPPDVIADAWRRLRDIKQPLKRLEAQLYAAAKERPVLLETFPDGTELWLGMTTVEGNLKIDPAIAREVITEMLGAEAADKSSKYEITQGRLEAAIKAIVPRGYGAAKMRAVLKEIEARNGSHRPTKHEVDTYKIPAATRQLPKAG